MEGEMQNVPSSKGVHPTRIISLINLTLGKCFIAVLSTRHEEGSFSYLPWLCAQQPLAEEEIKELSAITGKCAVEFVGVACCGHV